MTSKILYMGPEGTYTHEVAIKRFKRKNVILESVDSIPELCDILAEKPSLKGVVPIVNSTGGTIYPTVDALLDEKLSLKIEEEITINVKLALLGKKGAKVETIYSHFAPLRHCKKWLENKYPLARHIETSSTAAAAKIVSLSKASVAICGKKPASIYNLDILKYPVPGSVKTNVTHFFIISRKPDTIAKSNKTSLAVYLPNKPGGLLYFLQPLADAGLNLSNIVSRPIEGKPREFAFFMDIDGNINKSVFKKSLALAKKHANKVRVLGIYPSLRTYHL